MTLSPYRGYNIGNSTPENLLDYVQILQEEQVHTGVLTSAYDFENHKKLVPIQHSNVPVTYGDVSALEQDAGFHPKVNTW